MSDITKDNSREKYSTQPEPKDVLLQSFSSVFGYTDGIRFFFAPGRVNLIGEHTDYNGGHVFPCALNLGTYAGIKRRDDKRIRLYSVNFENDGIIEADISSELKPSPEYKWANYPLGIVDTFIKRGFIPGSGFDIAYYGTIPSGSGLSSSASIEVLTGFCLKEMYGFNVTKKDLALIGQYSENYFNGMNCGIMDQFASAFGKENHAILLDTATLEYEYVPLKLDGYKILIANTNKKHELTTSAYNDRRRESEEALKLLQTVVDIKTLGDLDEETFNRYSYVFTDSKNDSIDPDILFRRARHAVTENQRTIKAVKALNANDLVTFGKLMNDSHASLDKDYEVTCDELNCMQESILRCNTISLNRIYPDVFPANKDIVLGCRMTGGGFGGCTVALVDERALGIVTVEAGTRYICQTEIEPEFYVVDIKDGPNEI